MGGYGRNGTAPGAFTALDAGVECTSYYMGQSFFFRHTTTLGVLIPEKHWI
jgi:hypothetical protein